MAWLERNRVNGPFQLVVRYGEQRLKRSTRTCDEREANEIASRVDRRLRMLETGEVELPDGVDVLTFLMSEGQRSQRPSKPIPSVSLQQVCDKFLSSLPDGALEANTLLTMRIHLKHIQQILGRMLGSETSIGKPFRNMSMLDPSNRAGRGRKSARSRSKRN